MKSLLSPTALIMVLVAAATSQTVEAPGMIHGVVVDEGTKRPVARARIQIPELHRQTFTDSAGNYRIDSLTARSFSVQADGIGYLREIREVVLPYPPHTLCGEACSPWRPVDELNFYMRRRPTPLY